MKAQLLATIEGLSKLTLLLVQRAGDDGLPIIDINDCAEVLGPLNEAKKDLEHNPLPEYTPFMFESGLFQMALRNAYNEMSTDGETLRKAISQDTYQDIQSRLYPVLNVEQFVHICNLMKFEPRTFFGHPLRSKLEKA